MGVIVTSGKSWKPAPAGVHQGICCDVIDKGMVTEEYEGRKRTTHKVVIVWQINESDPETHLRYTVSKRYTVSQHEKATLRKDLQSWRGRPFTNDELRGFDLDHVLGVNALLNVVHNERDGNVYANVEAVMPIPKGTPKLAVQEYVRVQDRPKEPSTQEAGQDEIEESVPF